MFFCYSVEVHKGKQPPHCIFGMYSSSSCQWSHIENQDILKNSVTCRGRSCFTKHDNWSNFSNIFRNDYVWLWLFQGDKVFQYPLKFWGNYVSVLLTLDRKRFYLLQNFSSGFGLEIILQILGDIFRIYFRHGTNNTKSFLLLFHLVYIHLMFNYIHLIFSFYSLNIYIIHNIYIWLDIFVNMP